MHTYNTIRISQVGIPQQVKNVTLTIPPEFVDRLDGSFIVSWDALPSNCDPSDGVVLADGSIATCPRGEDADLLGYRYECAQARDTCR